VSAQQGTALLTPERQQAIAYARDLAKLAQQLRDQSELLPAPLDPDLVRDGPSKPRRISCLHLEMLGFTQLVEEQEADPRALLSLANEHLGPASDLIQAHGGVVEKFTTSGLLATFGARSDLDGPDQAALIAGMAVAGSNERFNAGAGSRHWLDFGIGISGGPAVVGRIGASHRWEMAVVGDCIVIAKRLASKAKAGEILLDETCYESVKDSVRARRVGWTWIHGRANPITSYVLSPTH
jgi:adenylate cyclase